MPRSQNRVLSAIVLTVFIDQMGVGMVLPIAAPLLMSPSSGLFAAATSAAGRSVWLGLLLGSFPIAQFFGAPILGALSDRFGRKKLFLASVAGTCLGYLLFGYAIMTRNLWLCFAGRMLDGFTGGNISIAMSAVADITEPKDRSRNFGLIGMTFGLGFILGPFIGGVLSNSTLVSWFSLETPYWFAAAMCGANLVLIRILFSETLRSPFRTPVRAGASLNNIRMVFRNREWTRLFLVMFLIVFGFNFFTQFFQVFLIERFQFNSTGIADLFAYTGLWLALSQGIANRALTRRYPPGKLVWITALLCALSYPLLLVPSHAWGIYLVVPLIALFTGINTPNLIALVSGQGGPGDQGMILGIRQSVQAIAMAVPPILAGLLTAVRVSLPVWAAAFFTIAGWMVWAGWKPKNIKSP